MRSFSLSILLLLATAPLSHAQLIAHEWGTFTSLQDETGRAIGGINTDDEPVPDFVHRAINLVQPAEASGKGIPPNDPDVTMRLETPVIYFHLPPGAQTQTVNLNVSFPGGWLTEYFPDVRTTGLNLDSSGSIGHLTESSLGTLTWQDVRIGAPGNAPQTTEPVWTSSRNVRCDPIRVGSESENFLFYRGVAHLDSPINVTRNSDVTSATIRLRDPSGYSPPRQLWLVDVNDRGRLAWRKIRPLGSFATALATVDTRLFSGEGYGDGASLREDLANALVDKGLFRDEAEALLNTWQQSYFENPGLRLFFLVDPAWTDRVLPLHISAPATITRVMVGRIELVTPRQRKLIHEIEAAPPPDSSLPLKTACPAYEQLGRFRNALLLDEVSRHPDSALQGLLQAYGIRAFAP